jgi:hypothetical protein
MSAAPTLSEARAAFVLAMLRRNGPFGLFTLAEEGEYRHARGLTLQQRDAAIDAFVARGWPRLHIGEEGVWVELSESARYVHSRFTPFRGSIMNACLAPVPGQEPGARGVRRRPAHGRWREWTFAGRWLERQ